MAYFRPREVDFLLALRPISTPLGEMLAWTDAAGALVRLDLPRGRTAETGLRNARRAGIEAALEPRSAAPVARQLDEYFAGERRSFDLELAASGTSFQRAVWRELRAIAYGETVSYAELARRLGRPGAARAIGQANGSNPIPVIVPCHRVVAADGSIGGYSGGLEIKRALLALEGAVPGSLF